MHGVLKYSLVFVANLKKIYSVWSFLWAIGHKNVLHQFNFPLILTTWRIVLANLTVAQLVTKCHAFYRTRILMSSFRSVVNSGAVRYLL